MQQKIDYTSDSVNGYPVYRRRDNGVNVDVRGHSVDNRFVVPYNPYLLAKFNCHLNVEVCTTVKSVKYIYKYVYKGYDCASLEFRELNGELNDEIQVDEIQNFLNGRYVGSTEASWRIFQYPICTFNRIQLFALIFTCPTVKMLFFGKVLRMKLLNEIIGIF